MVLVVQPRRGGALSSARVYVHACMHAWVSRNIFCSSSLFLPLSFVRMCAVFFFCFCFFSLLLLLLLLLFPASGHTNAQMPPPLLHLVDDRAPVKLCVPRTEGEIKDGARHPALVSISPLFLSLSLIRGSIRAFVRDFCRCLNLLVQSAFRPPSWLNINISRKVKQRGGPRKGGGLKREHHRQNYGGGPLLASYACVVYRAIARTAHDACERAKKSV